MACDRSYIRQIGRCLKERLREHTANVGSSTGSTFSAHCASCGGAPLFSDYGILTRYSGQREDDISEAFEINKKGITRVCEPSVSFLEKEIVYLS